MKIEFDDKKVQALVAGHIFGTMSEGAKEALIQNALAQLLQPANKNHRDGPTMLQEAFNKALAEVAVQVAAERLARPDVKEKVDKMVHEAVDEGLKRGKEEFSERVSEAVKKAIGRGW
jgi:diphthamide synthase (EF-2-diphthine--ammonia ligase)